MKKVLIFSQKKLFLYSGKQNFVVFSQKKVVHIFWETKLSNPKNKKFQEESFRAQKVKRTHSEKMSSYVLGRNSKKPKNEISYNSQKKVMNKFF